MGVCVAKRTQFHIPVFYNDCKNVNKGIGNEPGVKN